MIYKMTREIQTMLLERKFPLAIEYGPERTIRDAASDSAIVIGRDGDASDTFDFAHGSNPNPRRSSSRYLATQAEIYARSPLPGARSNEHEDLCEALLDAFLVSLHEWCKQATGVEPTLTDGRYVKIDPGFEQWPGVKYVLKFRVPRGVSKRDYDGLAQPTGSPAGVSTARQVR